MPDLGGDLSGHGGLIPEDARGDVGDRERVLAVVESPEVRDPVGGMVEVVTPEDLGVPPERHLPGVRRRSGGLLLGRCRASFGNETLSGDWKRLEQHAGGCDYESGPRSFQHSSNQEGPPRQTAGGRSIADLRKSFGLSPDFFPVIGPGFDHAESRDSLASPSPEVFAHRGSIRDVRTLPNTLGFQPRGWELDLRLTGLCKPGLRRGQVAGALAPGPTRFRPEGVRFEQPASAVRSSFPDRARWEPEHRARRRFAPPVPLSAGRTRR